MPLSVDFSTLSHFLHTFLSYYVLLHAGECFYLGGKKSENPRNGITMSLLYLFNSNEAKGKNKTKSKMALQTTTMNYP